MIRFFSVLICLLLFSDSFCFSQTVKGSLSGVITDNAGAIVSNAKVIISPVNINESNYLRETNTDFEGRFTFPNLPSGSYIITVNQEIFNVDTIRQIFIPKEKRSFITIEIGRACNNPPYEKTEVVLKSKIEIFNSSLIEALNHLLSEEERNELIIVSKRKVSFAGKMSISDLNIKVMEQKTIQEKADLTGDFKYISFSEFRATGSCLAVSISYIWAKGKKSDAIHMDGGGFTFEYRKEKGKWVGKKVSQWVS